MNNNENGFIHTLVLLAAIILSIFGVCHLYSNSNQNKISTRYNCGEVVSLKNSDKKYIVTYRSGSSYKLRDENGRTIYVESFEIKESKK